jgi:hypothetical protein
MIETLSRSEINAAAARIRRHDLRARLLPAGTRLADVPPEREGLAVAEWVELCWLDMRAAATALPEQADLPRISTARDNYGWRSLPSGSRFIG